MIIFTWLATCTACQTDTEHGYGQAALLMKWLRVDAKATNKLQAGFAANYFQNVTHCER